MLFWLQCAAQAGQFPLRRCKTRHVTRPWGRGRLPGREGGRVVRRANGMGYMIDVLSSWPRCVALFRDFDLQ